MAAKIGHASISEHGTIRGTAGDQTGKEVCTRNWYKHSKGWKVVRCTDPEMLEYIAEAMEKAAKNDNIGYDQIENSTLWDQIKDDGFDPSEADEPTETDCARLVRVCVQYACEKTGKNITVPDFYTATLANTLKKTGLFTILTASRYVDQDDLLVRGDILVTRTKGHTAVVLSNGSKVSSTSTSSSVKDYTFGERTLKKGMTGADVKELQTRLNKADFNCGKVDGDFGNVTLEAVKKFQKAKNLEVDGIVGKNTFAALKKISTAKVTKKVVVTGGSVNIRSTNNTSGKILDVAKKNEKYVWLETKEGWRKIEIADGTGWISGKYTRIVEE